jgi:hypothetical protein
MYSVLLGALINRLSFNFARSFNDTTNEQMRRGHVAINFYHTVDPDLRGQSLISGVGFVIPFFTP